jgi:hypothetical protein
MLERCEAWLFVIAFTEKYEKMKQDLLRIKSAVTAMKDKSKYFKLLVEIVLAIGNFINAGAQGGIHNYIHTCTYISTCKKRAHIFFIHVFSSLI